MPNFSTFNIDPKDLKTAIYGTDGTNQVQLLTDSSGALAISNVTITAGTIDAVATIEGGTINTVNTVDAVATINGGTINTVNTVDVVSAVLGTTVTTIQGGTINTVNTIDAVATINGGTINTVNTVDVVSAVLGTTVTTIQGGTLSQVTTLTAISQSHFVEDSVIDSPATNTTYTEIASGQLRRDTEFFKVYTYLVTNQTANTLDLKLQISADGTNWANDAELTTITQNTVPLVAQKFAKYTRVQYKVTNTSTTINVYFNGQGP